MQYFGQTGRFLKTRVLEHFRKMKKPIKLHFSLSLFQNNGHSPNEVLIQPVENIIYDPNPSSKLNNIQERNSLKKDIRRSERRHI